MPTIKDVARLAAVSTTTVSRVLNGDPAVAPETRAKVLAAMTSLEYRPSAIARGLRNSATQTVGVILPDVTNPFFAHVLRGVEEVAWEQGYQILIGDIGNNPERQLKYSEWLADRRTDGVLVLTTMGDMRPVLELSRRLPVVLACEYMDGQYFPSVSIDNVAAAFDATSHLLKLGHRRIGFINGPDGVILCRDRLRGYELAMRQVTPAAGELIDAGRFDIPSGRAAAGRLLDRPNRPTALFCANDEMAVGAIQAARSRNLRVPADLSVVGFDNIALAEVIEPALTTIAQPAYDLGRTAMELLLVAMGGQSQPDRRVLPHDLIVRQSSGAPCPERGER